MCPAIIGAFTFLVALTSFYNTCAQKSFRGAYEGELITPRCVLIIKSQKDSVIQGSVYTDPITHFPFYGIAGKGQIRGLIMLPETQGGEMILVGTQRKDTLDVTLISAADSTVTCRSKIMKVSGSVRYNPEHTFGKIVQYLDPALIGKWDYLYSLNADGTRVPSKITSMTVEYNSNGTWTVTTPELQRLTSKYGSAKTGMYVKFTWFTYKGKLTTKTQFIISGSMQEKMAAAGFPSPPSDSETVTTYQIRGDSLETISTSNARSYYLRKR